MTDTLTFDPTTVRHDRRVPADRPRALWIARFLARSSGDSAIEMRRANPIRAYIGPNGAGKTLAAVRDILPSLDAGRLVYSTVPLYDSTTGELHENYRPFTRWDDFMHARSADFVADEISGIASSRDHNNLHSEIINRSHQLRKLDNTFSWTAPAWRRADLSLREVTWAVTECRGYFPVPAQKRDDGGVLWAPRRLFRYRTYDMRDFDEWTAGKRDREPVAVKEWFAGENSREFESYRTLDAVDRLEAYDPDACPTCGLTVRKKTCGGHEPGAPSGRRPRRVPDFDQ